jgi:hypothetical protein
MVSPVPTISEFFLKITEDPHVTVWHISLYVTMLSLWQESGFKKQIKISREKLMKKAHFGSITTYHKCITQLQDFGYIKYRPTYDRYAGSMIEIISQQNIR